MSHSAGEYKSHAPIFLKVGAALFALTGLTVYVAYHVDLGNHAANMAFGLFIAAFKCTLVALIFMHLKEERGLIYKFLLFTVVFFLAMVFLFVLCLKDPIHNKFPEINMPWSKVIN